jgi:hypothetical protein
MKLAFPQLRSPFCLVWLRFELPQLVRNLALKTKSVDTSKQPGLHRHSIVSVDPESQSAFCRVRRDFARSEAPSGVPARVLVRLESNAFVHDDNSVLPSIFRPLNDRAVRATNTVQTARAPGLTSKPLLRETYFCLPLCRMSWSRRQRWRARSQHCVESTGTTIV